MVIFSLIIVKCLSFISGNSLCLEVCFIWCQHGQFLYLFHPSSFTMSVPIYLVCVSCKQDKVGSDNLRLLIGVVSPFIVNVIIDMIVFKSVILLFVFYLFSLVFCLFVCFLVSNFLPSFRLTKKKFLIFHSVSYIEFLADIFLFYSFNGCSRDYNMHLYLNHNLP